MAFPPWMYGFWLGGLILQALLVAALASRKAWRKFPVFTAYVVWSLLEAGIGYASSRSHAAYLLVYTVGGTISVALALALIHEIFRHLFLSHAALRKLASLVFYIVLMLLLILGAAVIYTHAPIWAKGTAIAVLLVEETSRIVEVGLIMFLFVFSTAFGLHWRQNVFGIALGLGVLASIKLGVVVLLPYMPSAGGVLGVVLMIANDCSLVIWLAYLLAPERVTSAAEVPKSAQLEQWNQALTELINQ